MSTGEFLLQEDSAQSASLYSSEALRHITELAVAATDLVETTTAQFGAIGTRLDKLEARSIPARQTESHAIAQPDQASISTVPTFKRSHDVRLAAFASGGTALALSSFYLLITNLGGQANHRPAHPHTDKHPRAAIRLISHQRDGHSSFKVPKRSQHKSATHRVRHDHKATHTAAPSVRPVTFTAHATEVHAAPPSAPAVTSASTTHRAVTASSSAAAAAEARQRHNTIVSISDSTITYQDGSHCTEVWNKAHTRYIIPPGCEQQ